LAICSCNWWHWTFAIIWRLHNRGSNNTHNRFITFVHLFPSNKPIAVNVIFTRFTNLFHRLQN